ncbi:hypothetical protein BGZ96_011987 [Linnemannia gamsii]|uniref:Tyrosine specific protein phosphatases domain-containing protein n=1 Tax=Linnemannia gamsii TaxID=64522 RepID=A0ABQ7JRR8_9FUNG|nr:hypothetical protein BGZ96_011987 [Linnemannia gamsii]
MSRFSISPIKVGDLSFLILDCPSDKSLPAYIPIFEEHNVTDLVRICEGSPYNTQPLTSIGIVVHDDMKFEDGTAPTKAIVARWLELNDEVFYDSPIPDRCIAVHCISGIGRAPVLVAISLVEAGMDPLDAIAYIRKARRGALNRVQIAFLDSGIGLESSVLFASEGAQVVCADINEKGAAATVEKITSLFGPGRAVSIRADVSKEEDVKKMMQLAVSEFGKLSIVFNNAGIMHPADDNALTTSEAIWDLTMNINVKGVWWGCKYAIEEMRKTGGGSIINTASFVALRGAATPQLAYTASKGAVLAKENIRFNSLCPGPLRTPLLMEFLNTDDKKNRRLVHVPMGRFGEAIEQAKAALFLASDESSYMTGTDMAVDGGLCAAYVTPEGETISNSPHVSYQ